MKSQSIPQLTTSSGGFLQQTSRQSILMETIQTSPNMWWNTWCWREIWGSHHYLLDTHHKQGCRLHSCHLVSSRIEALGHIIRACYISLAIYCPVKTHPTLIVSSWLGDHRQYLSDQRGGEQLEADYRCHIAANHLANEKLSPGPNCMRGLSVQASGSGP